MKKIVLSCFQFLAIICVASLVGCGKSEPVIPAGIPSITAQAEPIMYYKNMKFEKGEKVRIQVTSNVPQGVQAFEIKKLAGSSVIEADYPYTPVVGAGTVSINRVFEILVTEAVGSTVTVRFKVRNAQGTSFVASSVSYEVVAQGQGGGGVVPALQPLATVELGSQQTTTVNSYYASAAAGANGVYATADLAPLSATAKQAIDISFGTSDANGLAQIGTNAVRNVFISTKERANKGFQNDLGTNVSETTFKAVTGITSLATVTSTDISRIDHTTGAAGFATFANTGNSVFSFQNAQGVKGYIRVVSVAVDASASDKRVVKMEVLAQKKS